MQTAKQHNANQGVGESELMEIPEFNGTNLFVAEKFQSVHPTTLLMCNDKIPFYTNGIEKMTQANLLKSLIISDLTSNGFLAWNNNTMGVFDPVKKIYRKNKDRSAIGSGDIIACINGNYVEIEIKIGKDKQSPEQIEHQKKVEKSGGTYYVVKSMSDYNKIKSSWRV
jgi:hypothetical protein